LRDVNSKTAQQNNRNRIRHVSPETPGSACHVHAPGRQRVVPDHLVVFADDVCP
jgi:hypothetical protein